MSVAGMALLRRSWRVIVSRSKPWLPQARAFSAKKKPRASSANPSPKADASSSSNSFFQEQQRGTPDSLTAFLQSEDNLFGEREPRKPVDSQAAQKQQQQEFSFRDFLQDDNAFVSRPSQRSPPPPQPQGRLFRDNSPSKWSFNASADSDSLFGNTRPRGTGGLDPDPSDFSFKSIIQSSGELDLFSVKKPPEKKPADEDEEESIFDSPSFRVLRDSFFDKSRPRSQGAEASSGDTDWLSLVGSSSKPSDSVSLKELESSDFFTSTTKKQPAVKMYTYQELGERLRLLRPPLDQISSATGFSFRELGERLQKMRAMEEDGAQTQRLETFQELKDSLQLLSKKVQHPAQLPQPSRPPSIQELALMNRMGTNELMVPHITYIPPNEDLLEKYFSEEQMSSKQLLKLETTRLIKEFQIHETDTGTPQVQIAILTAKISNLQRHFRENHNNKRDKHSKRGFHGMIQDRKRLLWYLRRRDWDAYCNVLTKLKLPDIIHEKLGSRYK